MFGSGGEIWMGRSELEQALGHKLEKSALQNHEMFLNMAVPGNLKT